MFLIYRNGTAETLDTADAADDITLTVHQTKKRLQVQQGIKSIRKLRGLFDWLEDLTDSVVDAFAVVNFLSISFCFVDILYSTNYFIIDKQGQYNFLYFLWMAFLLIKLFAAVAVCTITSNKVSTKRVQSTGRDVRILGSCANNKHKEQVK